MVGMLDLRYFDPGVADDQGVGLRSFVVLREVATLLLWIK